MSECSTLMKESEALRILRAHNVWRRFTPDDPFAPPSPDDPQMVAPNELGIAIDVACRALAEIDAIKRSAASEIEMLRDAIRLTLEENMHLADGEDCTLIYLKRALATER